MLRESPLLDSGRREPPAMSRATYRLIALATLPLPLLGAYALGSPLVRLLPDLGQPISALLSLLGYLLVLLGCVVVWGVALLPLRRRAGFTPLSEELRTIEREGGLANAVAKEREAFEARARSSDPKERARHHGTFALVAGLFGVAALGISWMLWDAGYVLYAAAAALVVCPILAAYHAVQWLRARLERPG